MDNNTKENNNLTKKVTNSNAKKPQKARTAPTTPFSPAFTSGSGVVPVAS